MISCPDKVGSDNNSQDQSVMSSRPRNASRLRILLLPPNQWRPSWEAYSQGNAPDPTRIFDLMAERGVDVELIDPNGWPWNPFRGQHSLFEGLDPSRALRVLTRERDCDLVLACFESATVPLLFLRRLLGFKAPIAMIDIGLADSWTVRERILDFAVPRADAIFVLGTNQIDYIRNRWKTSARIEFFHQHIDTEFYTPAPTAAGPILTVGEDRGRDFDTFLAAVEGADADVIVKSKRVAVSEAKFPNVRVISSHLSSLEYRKLLIDCRLVVVPLVSSAHASGVGTVLEALAMGRPLIVSDSPGIRDYIIADETALTVPCNDVAALRRAIARLLAEPDTCARLAANGRRFVVEHCSHPVHARKLSDAIHRVVAGHKQHGGDFRS
jgi:glycosyltransferase involved in cell wall biosynthesis